ncbi:hypothetical protein IRZ71_17075 [Flavobacterium sp. ANB]|uniref:hypothetical protein n=1 Tax=unclassified Flavobacterium TaxID=196869 RepID=UPI0012B88A1A|nr:MULTISPECIES: hypothetical protein [unclassified Flavobacterium]MBF4518080.1 hypothetical protein [Flavobacterium sp. ANB]MTD71176.1 hypothetical protein [Flavobacterium sp. LC2016-13]
MKKLLLLLVFPANTVLVAQTKTDNIISFSSNTSVVNFEFSQKDNYAIDYQKYLNFPIQFSIYNPKPGFNPYKIESQKYYSFAHTNVLLKREMSNIEPEPIFPNQDKKKSFGEAIFEDVVDGLFK